ncbi:MAG: tetratricopeptide repeat protein [Myxococcota bacterium]
MSLLNDVLRDLERRESTQRATRVSPGGSGPARLRRSRIPALLIASLAALLLSWPEFSGPRPTLAPVGAGPLPPSAVVQGVRAELTDGGLQVHIRLDRPVRHRVLRRRDSLDLILADARLDQPLPPLGLPGTPLRNIESEQEGRNLRLHLSLANDPRVHVGVHRWGEEPELIVHLLPHTTADVAVGSRVAAFSPPRPSSPPASRARDSKAEQPVFVKRTASPPRAEQSYREALALERRGRRVQAEQTLREALREQPEHSQARLHLARLIAGRGAWEDAVALLEEGRALGPGRAELAWLEARIHAEAGALERAIALLESMPAETVGRAEHHAFLAALLQGRGEHARAETLYRTALGENSLRAAWWLGLAISLEAQSRYAAALESYQRARRIPGLDEASLAWVDGRLSELGALTR